jgi:hypothetical protein
MKTIIRNLLVAMLLVTVSFQIHAQGFVYDQQSATGPISPVGNGNVDGLYITTEPAEPLTQSFIPSLSTIDFAQLEFEYGVGAASVYVNLWTGSPNINSATLLGSTTPVSMPSGFVNDGLGVAGVADFYFSTPITLTLGQTYYLQPMVLSGGAQWAIVTIGDTYPSGELFINGNPFANPTDSWFREGVVAVPEPTTSALFGFCGLLAFAFKRRLKLPVLFLAGVLFTVQTLSVNAAIDSVVQATADAAGLTPVSGNPLMLTGTFWVTTIDPNGGLTTLPYPILPNDLSDLPTYLITNDIYIVDDTAGQISSSSTERMSSAEATSTVQAQSQIVANLIEMIQNPPTPSTNSDNGGTNQSFVPNGSASPIDTNGLWLEASNEAPNLGLLLHNPVGGDNYQLLSTTNLLNTNWDLGQILSDVANGEDAFSSVPLTNAMTFYRVHHANPVMEIYSDQTATEPNPTNADAGQVGTFYVEDEWYGATNDISVYYTISGTAQNGIDYSNLTGAVVVPASSDYAEIYIDPIADGLKPDQTVILTLTQNTNYLIDPANDLAINTLYANPEVYPTVRGDILRPCPNTSLTFDLASGVSDPRNLPLTYSILTWPTHGTLTGTPPNITYTPTNCYEGEDSFTFQASDGQYASSATVVLIISDPLNANSISVTTCRDTPVSLSLGSDICA